VAAAAGRAGVHGKSEWRNGVAGGGSVAVVCRVREAGRQRQAGERIQNQPIQNGENGGRYSAVWCYVQAWQVQVAKRSAERRIRGTRMVANAAAADPERAAAEGRR